MGAFELDYLESYIISYEETFEKHRESAFAILREECEQLPADATETEPRLMPQVDGTPGNV